jgi:heat shock protein HslJ
MKYLILILAMLAAVGLAGCRNQSAPEATEQFCASLQAFEDSVQQLEQITPDTTVGDAQQLRRAIEDAWKQVERSARNLTEVKTGAIDEAWQDLARTINTISRRDTLAEAAAGVAASAAQVRAAVDDLGNVTCPELARSGATPEAVTAEAVAPPVPSSTPLPVEDIPTPSPVKGVYTGQIPPTNGSARTLTLTLHPGGTASMVFSTTPAGEGFGQADLQAILEGAWTENADGTVGVTLDGAPDGAKLESFTFARQDGQLVAVEYDTALYGPSGITLASGSGPAVAPEGAEMTGPASPAVAPAAATAQPSPAQAASLTGTVWQLQQMEQGGAGVLLIPDPSLYTLVMADDGAAKATVDCSVGAGTYQVAGSSISFSIGWSAPSCPPSSLARQFAKYLEYADSYLLQEATLTISYSNNSGQLIFAASGP